MSELTIDLNEPYSGGGLGSGTVPVPPSAVAIGSHKYLVDTKSGLYKRAGIDVLQQRNTNNARDTLLLPQDVWRQQQESWHQGAGQRNLDREDALPYRFSRSFGVNPWEKYELSLLNSTALLDDLGDYASFLTQHKTYLACAHNTTIKKWATPLASPTSITVGTTPIISAAYDGDGAWTLHTDGQINYTNLDTGTVTEKMAPAGSATGGTFLAYVKDYLVVGVGNKLYDATGLYAGTPVWPSSAVYTSPVAGFTWKGAAEGQAAIYLIGGAGDKHVIHRVGVKNDGTGLEAAAVSAQLPEGENGVSIGSYLGFVFVGTNKGVRMATPSGASGDLTLGALIETLAPVYAFEGQDRFVWITGSTINPVADTGAVPGCPSSPVCGLYRADLSTFTVTASTPAYATDLHTTLETAKIVDSVTTWGDIRVFSVRNGGLYFETGSKVEIGWLEQGRVSYSVEDMKTALYAQAKWEPLDGIVSVDLSYDSTSPLRVLNWAIQGTVRSGNIPLNGAQFSRVDVRYVLSRSQTDATKGPIFTRFEMRSRVAKGRASRWTLPLINHEVLDLNGVPESRDTLTEFEFLLEIAQSGRMVALQEWGKTYQVVAKDYEWRPEKLTLNGSGWQGVFVLVVEEVK